MIFLLLIQAQTDDIQSDGSPVLHDWELYKAVKDNMNELRLKAYDYAKEWKEKYESWRTEIPEARILNLKHGLKLDSYHMDKIAA